MFGDPLEMPIVLCLVVYSVTMSLLFLRASMRKN